MPLVRYEIRNEHSLANPQLYRTAAKDDPEGLLEGVAMAGLVGIVRQLGDLAEFAAEVFRDLHEEVMATASRGHELLARVQQLEAEMPSVEKALLSETNQLRFAYTPGVDWHASIRNDQNHCTQGDLPRFIRSSYEECRGPPRLFLLDKFDVAGAGACLKRYTDPSFFRTEWASSELMKAERVQRDKRARREKKKGRRRRNADGQESILAEQYQSRFSHELSRELSQPNKAHPRHVPDAQGLRQHVTKTVNVTSGSPPETLDSSMDTPVPTVSEDLTSSRAKFQRSKIGEGLSKEWEETGPGVSHKDEIALQTQEETATIVADDGGSEGEQFLDALTTMEPDADSDSESHLRPDRHVDADQMAHTAESQPMSHEDLKVPELQTSADEKLTVLVEQSQRSNSIDPSRQEILLESRVVNNGRDGKGAASFTTATHARKQSSDSISSSSSRKTKHVQLLEEPHEGSRPGPEPYLLFKDEKRTTESNVQEPVLAKAQGVKVSKMVAAFESGSLEQVHAEVLEKERPSAIVVSDTLGSVADAVNQPTGEPDNFEVSPALTSESNSRENSPRPLDTSPAEADSKFLQSHGSPRSDEVKCTSPLSRVSVGSLDSPPDSPTFSALQSPVSSIRTERNILLSPGSQRMLFPAEMLSAGSPTAVPILASSPTSQEIRHPELFSLESGDGQEEPFSPTSSSSSSVHLPFSSQSKNSSEIASQSLASDNIIENSAVTLLSSVEDSSHLDSELPSRSVDEPLASMMVPEVVSPAPNSLEDLEELHDVSDKGQDLVHSPAGEYELNTSPRTEGVGYSHDPILSTSHSSNDYVSMSPSMSNKFPNHAESKVEGKAPLEPIIPTSLPLPSLSLQDGTAVVSNSNRDPPSKSPLVQDVTLPKLSPVEQEKPSLPSASSRSFETSEFSYSEASLDSKFMPRAAHRRYPSLPLVEKIGQDFSHAIPSNSSRRSPESLIPSKVMPGAQLPAKSASKTSSPSPMSRAVYDLPYPTVKAAHNRFHSFSSSEKSLKSMLEASSPPLKPSQPLFTSSSPSRHVPDTQIPAPKFISDLRSPSQTLSNLPAPTPPSKIERDFPPPPPPSSSPPTLSATKSSAAVDVQDGLLEAIASHDKSTLKKVKTMQNPSLRKGDERSHLLEQIRAQSFNLRHTVVEKVDPPLPRPVTNINVAAILEKANAIRQAFAGSDEDDEDNDDWSDI